MDLGIPNKHGFKSNTEILEIQRKNKMVRSCNVAALTSSTDKLSYKRCIKIGMKKVAKKPVKLNVIEKLILKYHF